MTKIKNVGFLAKKRFFRVSADTMT